MRALFGFGMAICFAAACALEGDGISLMQAVMMLAVGMPMTAIGAIKSGICE